MKRVCCRILALAAVVISVASPSFAQAQESKWGHSYQLTPLDHKRLRTKGLTDREVYIVANTANLMHLDVEFIANYLLVGRTVGNLRSTTGVPQEQVITP